MQIPSNQYPTPPTMQPSSKKRDPNETGSTSSREINSGESKAKYQKRPPEIDTLTERLSKLSIEDSLISGVKRKEDQIEGARREAPMAKLGKKLYYDRDDKLVERLPITADGTTQTAAIRHTITLLNEAIKEKKYNLMAKLHTILELSNIEESTIKALLNEIDD